ncbi:glycosyl transferase [Aneurinibacillus migulanus]|uniref:glycosyltransferase n=1 Tax=Aneurinibacillus migulanus TaxID=47500 RepID=UPI0005BDB4AC|nr:glycosyltransferase family 2 protein [Aneurinibacillus migulanus]KIV59512.1 glycosyl transferase [Aneurinibacillus migulanus]KPD07549.1 glycosyl transferase [Aneurinibacillus migulanus]MCP1357491.1 glycosyltransferase [Aneurinibacillus migulanus]MED4731638.1 glycosyltransferase [Aneurinibacillus migulanus]
MSPNLNPLNTNTKTKKRKVYIPVITKFWLSHSIALLWMCFSIYISMPWLKDLSNIISFPVALFIIMGISYVPGYMSAFLVASLAFDRQPPFKNEFPTDAVTVLIAAYNEGERIFNTLQYLSSQDYKGKINTIIINNRSTDNTVSEALRAKQELDLNLDIIYEDNAGKFHALNKGLQHVTTPYVITLDADTLLHPSAIRYLVARIKSSPEDICAVAGSILTKNSRENIWAKIQEWDYFLGISSIKRLQGLYQGTLVAQGAYSLYKTSCIKEIGGWPDAIGEDIVLTWRLLQKGWKVYFEPLAVAFTEVPANFKHFVRQRSRWARGMIEGLREIKPWEQSQVYTKYLTFINLIMPYLDFTYTFFWIPGLILACFGHYWIVGPMTLFVLPLTLISYSLLYFFQKKYVFKPLNLKVRKNFLGFLLFVLFYQMIMSPVSTYGYIQEMFKLQRVWK